MCAACSVISQQAISCCIFCVTFSQNCRSVLCMVEFVSLFALRSVFFRNPVLRMPSNVTLRTGNYTHLCKGTLVTQVSAYPCRGDHFKSVQCTRVDAVDPFIWG